MSFTSGTGRERQVYDRAELWTHQYWTAAQQERAEKTCALLPPDVRSVLDVGCGAGIVTQELARRYPRVVGLDFAFTPLLQVQNAGIEAVQATGTALPFADDSFDGVISTEMIEHLGRSIRFKALAEMARVSRRYILVTVPYREVLEGGRVKCLECGCIFHVWHHTMSFDESVMASLVPGFRVMKLSKIGGLTRRYPRWLFRVLQMFDSYPYVAPGGATCPQCGNTEHYDRQRPLVVYPLIALQRILPWRKRSRWIAALYVKA